MHKTANTMHQSAGALARVAVKVPVVSVPAENTASLLLVHAPVADAPDESLDQKLSVPHVPVGVVPVPAVAPLLSQYCVAAMAGLTSNPGAVTINSAHAINLARLALRFMTIIPLRV
jgi:hypothetical protein